MKGFSVLLCMVGAIFSVSATDYCSNSICMGVTHIACGNSGNFHSSCPADAKIVTMTDSLKQLLVNVHNEKRNYIAGGNDANHRPACRMASMQWDDELASLAALNVRQCKMAHDSCHDTNDFKASGQNLAYNAVFGTTDNAAMLKDAVERWYNEVKNSQQAYIDSYPNNFPIPLIAHFTVMVADRNTRLGCAAATYTPLGNFNPYYLVACNYATTNMVNLPVYAKCDKAASSCTTGTNPIYPNLCSTSEVYGDN